MPNRSPPRPLMSWQPLKQQLRRWRGVMMITPAVAGLVLLLRYSGALQSLEWAALDGFFQQRPAEPLDPSIVIVGITETDIQTIQQVPLSDALLAKLLQTIKQQQPRAIGLDLYRDLPVPPGQSDLIKLFETTPNLIGIKKVIGDETNPPISPNPTLKRLGQVSMNDIVPDADGKIRRSLQIVTLDDGNWVENLSLTLAQIYLKAEGITPDPNAPDLQLGKARLIPFQPNDGGYVRADAGGYQTFINFRGTHHFRTLSVTDVLHNRIPPDLFRDRIVLVGATAKSLKDFFYTPYSSWSDSPTQMAGVELQAQMTSQIIQAALHGRPLIRVLPKPLEWLWITLWSGVGAVLAWSFRKTYGSVLTLAAAGGRLIGLCFWAFVQGGWWLPSVPPLIALITAASVIDRYAVVQAHQQQRTSSGWGRYILPPQAYPVLLTAQSPANQQWTATVLSISIQAVQPTAAQTNPVTAGLNDFISLITERVLHHGGILDQFCDNAVIAIFALPSTEAAIAHNAEQALQCALGLLGDLPELQRLWQAQGYPAPIQIGVATGKVLLGQISRGERLDSIIWGDAVHQASRLSHSQGFSDRPLPSNPPITLLINEATYHVTQAASMA